MIASILPLVIYIYIHIYIHIYIYIYIYKLFSETKKRMRVKSKRDAEFRSERAARAHKPLAIALIRLSVPGNKGEK